MDTEELMIEMSRQFQTAFSKEWYLELLEKVVLLRGYSLRNIIFIHLQNPKATLVRSYMDWANEKRNVKRGQRGIYIMSPYRVDKKLPPYDIISTQIKFKPIFGFDISQTVLDDQYEVREKIIDEPISSSAKEIFEAICLAFNCTITYQRLEIDNIGFYSARENKFVLNLSFSDNELIISLLYLLAEQQIKEALEKTNNEKKLIFKSVVYILAQKLNISLSQSYFDFFMLLEKEITFEKFENALLSISDFVLTSMNQILDKIKNPITENADTPMSLLQKLNVAAASKTAKSISEGRQYGNIF